MEYFKELQGFPIHIPIQKTYCPVCDRGIFLPRTQTSLFKTCAQRKAGRRQRARRRFACCLYPSHGPLRFITSHSRFALASAMRKTKRLRRRLGIFRNSSIKRRTPIERRSRKNSRSKLPIFKLTNKNQKLLGRRFVDS